MVVFTYDPDVDTGAVNTYFTDTFVFGLHGGGTANTDGHAGSQGLKGGAGGGGSLYRVEASEYGPGGQISFDYNPGSDVDTGLLFGIGGDSDLTHPAFTISQTSAGAVTITNGVQTVSSANGVLATNTEKPWRIEYAITSALGVPDGYVRLYIDDVLVAAINDSPLVHTTSSGGIVHYGLWNFFLMAFSNDRPVFDRVKWEEVPVTAPPPDFPPDPPGVDPLPLPDYENPCSIRTPLIWGVIELLDNFNVSPIEFSYLQFAQTPLRDASTYYGGWKAPRLLSFSGFRKVASKWLTGSLEAQGGTAVLADTDHVVRTAVSTHGGSLLGSRIWIYLISNVLRMAEGIPRLLATGLLTEDPLTSHLTATVKFRDTFGSDFVNLLAGETMIPQRAVEEDFPGYGLSGIDSANISWLGVPIIYGTHTDEGRLIPAGRVPLIYVGEVSGMHCALLCGHAVAGGVISVYDNAGDGEDIDDMPVLLLWGTDAWGPGQAGWAGVNPSGAALYTRIGSNDYTLIFLSEAIGLEFKAGKRTLCANTHGRDSNGDGTGYEITNLHEIYLHFLKNDGLAVWRSGAPLTTPTFEFYPGDTPLALLDEASWITAQITSAQYKADGFKGAFVLGASGAQQPLRSVVAQFNVQCHVSLGIDAGFRYFVKMLDRDRTTATAGIRTVTAVRDTLGSEPLEAPLEPELLINNLRALGGLNYRRNVYEKIGQWGDAQSFARFGNRVAQPETYTLIQDDATGIALAAERLDFRAVPRRLIHWRESLCGLRHTVLDLVKLTHFNGDGTAGYSERIVWIQSVSLNADFTVSVEAYDVDDLLT